MRKICIVGLGYVGLPLAVEFSKVFPTIGFDINKKRISELKKAYDYSSEVETSELKKAKITYSDDEKDIKQCNFIIVTVPTPIDDKFKPDLTAVESASKLVGRNLSKGSIIVYESTVYPGVTEEICAPLIEKASGLKYGVDFKMGYSPERINPGDKEHNVRKILKIVSGMDPETTEEVANTYSKIIDAGVYKARNIKTAEAAKAIENIQRDLNIALMNELSLIFNKLGLNTMEVIEAAATKWNFHKYTPGLVGGHCIGIDPYYVTYKAQQVGYEPKVILAGRNINEYMSRFVVELFEKAASELKVKPKTVLILGVTFKENVKDVRNSKVKDIIKILQKKKYNVLAYDPIVPSDVVEEEFGVKNTPFESIDKVDAIILCTPHAEFRKMKLVQLQKKLRYPILIDVKSVFSRDEAAKLGLNYKSL